MKVRGNLNPQPVTVESCFNEPDMAYVRIRANVQEIKTVDEQSGNEITYFEYDEIILKVSDYDALQYDIENFINSIVGSAETNE